MCLQLQELLLSEDISRFLIHQFFHQLTSKNLHHLEFDGEFKARQVENGYNRLPLLVVEGNIKNIFENSEDVKKIQLKALAFDSENRMIASHFTYAGNVLTDEQLEEFSPLDITAMRHSEDMGFLKFFRIRINSRKQFKYRSSKKGNTFSTRFFKVCSEHKTNIGTNSKLCTQ